MVSENKNEEYTLESPIKGYELDERLRSLTMPEYLLERARERAESKNRRPDYIVNGITGESRDFSGVDEETRRVASAMHKRGLRKLDTILIMCHDTFYTYTFFIGVWRANGMLRAIYADEDEETVLSKVEESAVRWILCEPKEAEICLSVAKKVNWDLEVIVTGEYVGCTSLASLFEDDGAEFANLDKWSLIIKSTRQIYSEWTNRILYKIKMPTLQITPDDTAVIYPTSGTTGKSKGALHIHQNLISIIDVIARFFPLSDEKPNYVMSHPTHTAGAAFALAVVAAGKTLLVDYLPTRTNETMIQVIQNHKPGMLWSFAPLVVGLLNHPDLQKYDLGSIDIICAGGEAFLSLGLHLMPNLKSIVNVYGSTELGAVTLSLNFENDRMELYPNTPPTSVGKLIPGISAQIRSIDSHEILGPNQRGLIYIKSIHAFKCYYKNEKATNDSIQNEWFNTGDVGYYDENGFLFVVDRIKEMFKYESHHIAPNDIEDIIRQHPDVCECCVIGILQPNGYEKLPRAFVTLKNGSSASADDIYNFTNDKLPAYKQLREGLFILPEIPKGKTGKTARSLMHELHHP